MKFNERIMYKKGQYGESIIDEYLKSKNIIPYIPSTNTSHPFDRLCATMDKKRIFISEVKSVSKRIKYDDTGISIKHYEDYKYIIDKYKIDVFIFFVDEKLKEVYGNYIHELEKDYYDDIKKKKYPLIEVDNRGYAVGGKIIFFPMVNMKRNIMSITENDIVELKKLSNYNYVQNPRC